MREIWRDVLNWEGAYQVSNLGRVRSLDRWTENKSNTGKLCKGKVLKPHLNKGYPQVTFYFMQKPKKFKIHRLVAAAFLKPVKGKPHVNHKDFNPANNRVNNLEWVTHSENMLHSSAAGRANAPKGSAHPHSKLTEVQVIKIKKLLARRANGEKIKQRDIAAKFGITEYHVNHIKRGSIWKHITI